MQGGRREGFVDKLKIFNFGYQDERDEQKGGMGTHLVDEKIRGSVSGDNESISLDRVEPLDLSCKIRKLCHYQAWIIR